MGVANRAQQLHSHPPGRPLSQRPKNLAKVTSRLTAYFGRDEATKVALVALEFGAMDGRPESSALRSLELTGVAVVQVAVGEVHDFHGRPGDGAVSAVLLGLVDCLVRRLEQDTKILRSSTLAGYA